MSGGGGFLPFDPEGLWGWERRRLFISVVVPRPIGRISARSLEGVRHLAPFGRFGAPASGPLGVGASIGLP